MAHGQFAARQSVHSCANGCHHPNGSKVTTHSLTGLLLPASVVGYDVMVCVGVKRFLGHQQREEIRTTLLKEYGIHLSTGEISNLTKRFVQYLDRLHRARSESLKAVLISDGGWPMHVDATGEHGRGTLFAVMAGWRQWVLGAWKVATENADLLLPCMRETVRYFGAPSAAMRDLGRAVIPSINELIEEIGVDIPVLACHQHFLADVGKDLLDPSHATLRDLFRRTGVRQKLRDLTRELGRELGEGVDDARKAVRTWQSLAEAGHRVPSGREGIAVVRAMSQWALDYAADATGHDFPFDRPYLDLYDRCLIALRATDAFLRTPPDDQKVVRALKRLNRLLVPVESEVPFSQTALRLRRRATLLDEMRDILRLAGKLPEDETPQQIEDMRNQFDTWVTSLKQRRPARGPAPDIREAIDIILQHIETHGPNLWGHAILLEKDAGMRVRLVSRTNYLIENRFKEMKHGERRRSGRRILTQDLEHLPAEALLVSNLQREDYVHIVCGSLDRLPEAFAQLDQDEQAKRLMAIPPSDRDGLEEVLQIATASLSTPDRRVVRTKAMDLWMRSAAGSRAPRYES
ncbi:MAG: hypothetical protein Q8N45_10820 [Anaerolineales bacterium]|nr:hypothetical protein [Anaerolineales bacterium]